MTANTIPAALVSNIGRLTEQARAELALTSTDPHLSQAITGLADAMDHVAELLDYQQEFLVSLRDRKADSR